MPDTGGSLDIHEKFERPQVGQQFKAVSGSLTRKQQDYVLRGIQTAGLMEFLRHEPLASIEFLVIPANGRYFWPSKRLQVKADRAAHSYGEHFIAGKVWSVSSAGRTRLDAIRRSLVHELGHHVLLRGDSAIHGLAQQAYSASRGRRISLYADEDWIEYFCETFTAYAFHRAALRKHDPHGHGMMQKVEEVLHAQVIQRNHD